MQWYTTLFGILLIASDVVIFRRSIFHDYKKIISFALVNKDMSFFFTVKIYFDYWNQLKKFHTSINELSQSLMYVLKFWLNLNF